MDTMAFFHTASTLSFVHKDIRNQLDLQGNALTLNIAGIIGTKEMASEKVRIKVTTPYVSESVKFTVHPSIYLGNKSYDYKDLRNKYRHSDVLLDDKMDIKRFKVVLGQDNYYLFFPVQYRKGKRNEPWAVKTKHGWTLSGPTPKHKVVKIAAVASHVAAEDDGLVAQMKTWFSMVSYSTRVNISGCSQEHKGRLNN